MSPRETSLFGVRLFSTDLHTAAESLVTAALNGTSGLVCVANVDMVTRAKRDPKLLLAMRKAFLVVTDGMPLVWALRRLGLESTERVYGPRLMEEVCRRASSSGVPVFLYGGTQTEIELLQDKVKGFAPGLLITGAVAPPQLPQDPPFDPEITRRINESGARIVFVGLGCPKQEYWMLNHSSHLHGLSIGVGLAFAQLAGTKPRAPAWMQRRGIEWIYRLAQEPGRLWKRYLIGNSLFVWYLLQEWRCRAATHGR